jgi:NodT family efflux transporter outer membrane factor (OMF) lipoprotein
MKSFWNLSVALGLILVVAGCAAPDLGPRASMRDADRLAAQSSLGAVALSAAVWPAENWWTRYGDAQLNNLMDEALAHSPTLKMAEARVRQSQALLGQAEAAKQPQVGLADKNSRQRFSEHGTTAPPVAGQWKWVNEATFSGNLEFDFWGKNQAAIAAAVGTAHAVEVEAHASRLILVTAILRSYARLQQAWLQHDLALETLHESRQILALTQQRARAHIDSAVELKQAESLLPAAELSVARLDEAIELTQGELAALAGAGPDRGLRLQRPALPDTLTTALPSNLPAELIGRRPDVIAQRWRVEAASQEIVVAKAQFYPNISLTGLIGLQSLGFGNFGAGGSRIAGVGPALSLPIFDGGRRRGNLAGRNADYDYAVEQYNATVIDAVRDVVSQLVSLRAVDQQRALQREALDTADQTCTLAVERYQRGIGNYLQVLATQLQRVAIRRQAVDLSMRAIDLDIALTRALGGGYQPNS